MDGINKELRLRRRELASTPVPSVYFGGGTPSLLTEQELSRIFATLREEGYWGAAAGARGKDQAAKPAGRSSDVPDGLTQSADSPSDVSVGDPNNQSSSANKNLDISPPFETSDGRTEITLEANPDDLDEATIQMLAASPVNRLSIGIQSFFEEDLRFMNRAHSAAEARAAVEKVNRAGFQDVSIDLIYGGQTTSDEMWAENLRMATDLGVTHISAYALTVEPKTALGINVAKGNIADTDDAKFDRHFNMLVDHLTAAGYRHYEISNFCLPGHPSQHNSGYWSGQPYLGIGPGAHGFDGGLRRRWNVSNNAAYAKALQEIKDREAYDAAQGFLYEEEVLSANDRYNEYIMTALRRDSGVRLVELEAAFGSEKANHFAQSQQANVAAGLFEGEPTSVYRLSRAGLMRADGIAGDGFWLA